MQNDYSRNPRSGVASALFDGNEIEAFIELATLAAKQSKKDGKLWAVSFVERRRVSFVGQGDARSRLVALARELPETAGAIDLLPSEEIMLVTAPAKRIRPGKEWVAAMAHDDECPRLEPKAAIASCRCSPAVEVRERDAVN